MATEANPLLHAFDRKLGRSQPEIDQMELVSPLPHALEQRPERAARERRLKGKVCLLQTELLDTAQCVRPQWPPSPAKTLTVPALSYLR